MTSPPSSKRRHGMRRHSGLPSTSKLEQWVLVGFIALLALMPLMLGTTAQRPWPMLVSRLGIGAIFLMFVLARLKTARPVQITGLWLVFLFATTVTLLQVVPLPPWLLNVLSPQADALYHRTLDGLGLYGTGQWRPLSLDAPETWQAASGYAALLMVYLIAANLFAHKENMTRILLAIAITGFGVAMLGFIQKAVGTDRILGLIPFDQEVPFFFSSFINPNHMAGFLGMCVPIQISFALKTRARQKRLFYLLMALVSSTAIFMSLSRGGIVAFLIGEALLGFMLWRRRGSRSDVLWIQIVVAAVLGLSAILALTEISREFDANSTVQEADVIAISSKPMMWEDTFDMLGAFPLTGIGAEAFKVAYPVYKSIPHDKHFTHPENIVLQTLVEHGVLVGGLVLFATLLGLWLIFRRRRLKRYEIGAFAALVVIAVHNYVDFNLSSFAVSVPFVTLLAILTVRVSETSRKRWVIVRNMPNWLLAVFAFAALCVVVGGLFYWQRGRLPVDQQRLHAVAYERDLPIPEFEHVMNRALKRHPADFYLRLLASERYVAGSYGDLPMKLLHLSKAKSLNPTSPLVDMMLGRAWARIGNMEKAKEAYARVCRMVLPHVPMADRWTNMLRSGLTLADLVDIVSPSEARVLELSRFLLNNGAHALAKKLLLGWLETNESGAAQTLYLLGLIAVEEDKAAEAESFARRLIHDFPNNYGGYLLLGKLNMRAGHYKKALGWMEKADKVAPYNLEIWFPKAHLLMRLGRLDEADDLADRIHGISWNHPAKKLNAYLLSGDIAMAAERYYDAQKEYERALVYAPRHAGIHYKLALAAEKREDFRGALRHYRIAEQLGSDDARAAEAVKRLERLAPLPQAKENP